MTIAVVDYRKGNLKSVERGLRAVGGDARITADAAEIACADAIVLPGVGAFADAMASLHELGQDQAIRERIAAGMPFLGICLGLQLLFAEGDEGAAAGEGGELVRPQGLGILPGVVRKMPSEDAHGRAFKVPHVGWNTVEHVEGRASRLFSGISSGEHFYFTHSYVAPDCDAACATTEHSVRFTSAVDVDGRVFGVQFHPEKSSDAGLRVLANFLDVVRGSCDSR